MSKAIIASIRKNQQLRGSLLLTAQELAHRADGYNGHVRISYSYLAQKCHYSKRTAMRHINRLLGMGIIRVQRFWAPNNKWGINCYRFVIPWQKPSARQGNSDIPSPILPTARNTEEREKYGSLRDEEKGREMVLSWLSPGSKLWELTNEF
jgi:Winged helix-turn-helix DNA-binding